MDQPINEAVENYADSIDKEVSELFDEEIAEALDFFADEFLAKMMKLMMQSQSVEGVLETAKKHSAHEDFSVDDLAVNYDKIDFERAWNYTRSFVGELLSLDEEDEETEEPKINDAVADIIKKVVRNPKFENAIKDKIGTKIDTSELEAEKQSLRKKRGQLMGAKDKLGLQLDSLDILDRHYDRKYNDMQDRLDNLYDEIEDVEESIADVEMRISSIYQQKVSGDQVYRFAAIRFIDFCCILINYMIYLQMQRKKSL